MEGPILWEAIVFALAVAAPVGPVSLLCVDRTLDRGWLSGLSVGLGAALADAVYAFLANSSVAAVHLLLGHEKTVRIAGALLLVLLGGIGVLRPARSVSSRPRSVRLPTLVGTTFLFTLSNPATILPFVALAGGVGINAGHSGLVASAAFVTGVFTGSLLWWGFVSGAARLLRSQLTAAARVWISRVAGVGLAAFGVAILMGLT